ncbi:MAG: HAD family hydrolase [Acidobacteria bacterium]|nr:HAD family hydrolase [Acidobacteriota bacterium]
MRPEPCAVLFDLDGTLYPHRRFVLSGFASVAAHVERSWGVDASEAFALLARATRVGRGRELQALVHRFDLPAWLVPQLVEIIRAHEPRLRLPRVSARVLQALRPAWRTGIVTNGPPDIQARKVTALGLRSLVDTVVYAHATGRGLGKPDRAPFMDAARRLGVRAAQAVFVGDDPVADISGARRAGMCAVHLWRRHGADVRAACAADAVIESLDEVPSVAMALIDGRRAYVV